ncbi:hypothetical protein VP01_290g2 [Puccinia sorghi]|uniref:Uncharacterized protein n=1 Tax=Puccinia sorghi TaxID=27349 RepID=A0A0L6V1D9_9BASI|nr:hypothetical protein VP01_290g2 [Puccinia sorghi]
MSSNFALLLYSKSTPYFMHTFHLSMLHIRTLDFTNSLLNTQKITITVIPPGRSCPSRRYQTLPSTTPNNANQILIMNDRELNKSKREVNIREGNRGSMASRVSGAVLVAGARRQHWLGVGGVRVAVVLVVLTVGVCRAGGLGVGLWGGQRGGAVGRRGIRVAGLLRISGLVAMQMPLGREREGEEQSYQRCHSRRGEPRYGGRAGRGLYGRDRRSCNGPPACLRRRSRCGCRWGSRTSRWGWARVAGHRSWRSHWKGSRWGVHYLRPRRAQSRTAGGRPGPSLRPKEAATDHHHVSPDSAAPCQSSWRRSRPAHGPTAPLGQRSTTATGHGRPHSHPNHPSRLHRHRHAFRSNSPPGPWTGHRSQLVSMGCRLRDSRQLLSGSEPHASAGLPVPLEGLSGDRIERTYKKPAPRSAASLREKNQHTSKSSHRHGNAPTGMGDIFGGRVWLARGIWDDIPVAVADAESRNHNPCCNKKRTSGGIVVQDWTRRQKEISGEEKEGGRAEPKAIGAMHPRVQDGHIAAAAGGGSRSRRKRESSCHESEMRSDRAIFLALSISPLATFWHTFFFFFLWISARAGFLRGASSCPSSDPGLGCLRGNHIIIILLFRARKASRRICSSAARDCEPPIFFIHLAHPLTSTNVCNLSRCPPLLIIYREPASEKGPEVVPQPVSSFIDSRGKSSQLRYAILFSGSTSTVADRRCIFSLAAAFGSLLNAIFEGASKESDFAASDARSGSGWGGDHPAGALRVCSQHRSELEVQDVLPPHEIIAFTSMMSSASHSFLGLKTPLSLLQGTCKGLPPCWTRRRLRWLCVYYALNPLDLPTFNLHFMILMLISLHQYSSWYCAKELGRTLKDLVLSGGYVFGFFAYSSSQHGTPPSKAMENPQNFIRLQASVLERNGFTANKVKGFPVNRGTFGYPVKRFPRPRYLRSRQPLKLLFPFVEDQSSKISIRSSSPWLCTFPLQCLLDHG